MGKSTRAEISALAKSVQSAERPALPERKTGIPEFLSENKPASRAITQMNQKNPANLQICRFIGVVHYTAAR
ncbi:MAG: hypothetical protein J5616_02065 [Bacteroidaceae bacterium]|nr:hypothetical protein [Bacteroidaceae bacterium]